MTTSSTYKRMVLDRSIEEMEKLRKDYVEEMEDARDRGKSTSGLKNKAMNRLEDETNKALDKQLRDEQLIEDYGRDAPKSRGFMRRADGGTATMPEDLGYMVGGAMKEKKRGPIKYAAGGAIKGKKFSGIF